MKEVIDFKQAQTDKTVDKLRNNIRDLINMNDQYKKLIADQSTKIIELEKTVKNLKKERSEYYGASQGPTTNTWKLYRQV